MKKRIFCLALALLMLVGMLPVSAFAEGFTPEPPECNQGCNQTSVSAHQDQCAIKEYYRGIYLNYSAQELYNMKDILGEDAWAFIVGASWSLDNAKAQELNTLIQNGGPTTPENPCKCCENCTGAEDCECGCGECDYCEPTETDPTTPSTPENPCKCCENCTGAEGCECGCGECQFCEPTETDPTTPSIPENPCACCEDCTGAEDCECGCGECQFCETEIPDLPTLTDPETNVEVTIETLPEGVDLAVKSDVDVTPQLNKYGIPASNAVFALDISLVNADNSEHQPGSALVKVPVSAPVGTKIGILHNDTFMGVTEVLSDNTVEFYTDSFSEFAGFTVDFHYNGVDFSIDGRTEIILSKLFEEMGITENAFDAKSVVFSDNTLIGVAQQADGDWLLTSLQAFQTEETLIITFSDHTIVIDVTDEQDAGTADGHARYYLLGSKLENGQEYYNSYSTIVRYYPYSSDLGTAHIDFYQLDSNGNQLGNMDTGNHFWQGNTGTLKIAVRWYTQNNTYWYHLSELQRVYVTEESGNTNAFQISKKNTNLLNSYIKFRSYSTAISLPDAAHLCSVQIASRASLNTQSRTVIVRLNEQEVERHEDVLFPNRGDTDTAIIVNQANENRYYYKGASYSGTTYTLDFYDYKYELNLNHNNGTGDVTTQTAGPIAANSNVFNVSAVQPKRAGYKFIGWADSSTASAAQYTSSITVNGIQSTDGTTKTASKTVYAVWQEIPDVTIHHYLQGTTTKVANDTVVALPYGQSVTVANYKQNITNYEYVSCSPTSFTVGTTEAGNTATIYYKNVTKYTVTWKNWDGTVLETDSVTHGGSATYNGATPAKNIAGYSSTFTGWDKGATISNVTSSVAVTAQFSSSRNTYSIGYNLDGGALSSGVTNPTSYTVDTATFTLNNPKRNGYKFTGWSESVDPVNWTSGFVEINTGAYQPYNSSYPNAYYSEKIYLEAGVTYTLTGYSGGVRWRYFDLNGNYLGNLSQSTTFTPQQNGYVNILLYENHTAANRDSVRITSSQGTTVPIVTGSTGNRYYTANWEEIPDVVIHHYLEGTTTPVADDTVLTLAYGDIVTVANHKVTPQDAQYLSCSVATLTVGDTAAANTAIIFYKQNESHPVTYQYDGTVPDGAPAVPQPSDKNVGDIVTVAEAPALAGYTFSGWTTVDATVTDGNFTMPAKAVTFTGSWSVNQYTITYNHNDKDTNPTTFTVSYDIEDALTLAEAPTRDGYEFKGWKLSNVTGTNWTADTFAAGAKFNQKYGNVTFVAQWKKIHTVVWKNGTMVLETDKVVDGESASFNGEKPTKEKAGYECTFADWFNDTDGDSLNGTTIQKVTKDLEIVARFDEKPVEYTITYELAGGVLPAGEISCEKNYTVNDPVTLMAAPTKDGYRFTGWLLNETLDYPVGHWKADTYGASKSFNTGKYGDITLVAQWERQTGNLVLAYVGDGAPAIVNVSGEGLNINLVISADKTIVNLPTGDYTVTAQSGNASYSASVAPSGENNAEVTADTANPATVEVTVASRGLKWFTGFHRMTNRCN